MILDFTGLPLNVGDRVIFLDNISPINPSFLAWGDVVELLPLTERVKLKCSGDYCILTHRSNIVKHASQQPVDQKPV